MTLAVAVGVHEGMRTGRSRSSRRAQGWAACEAKRQVSACRAGGASLGGHGLPGRQRAPRGVGTGYMNRLDV